MTQVPSRPVAAIVGTDGPAVQALLGAAIARWRSSGIKVCGVLAETHGIPDRTCGAGLLRDIASGRPYRIYLETPPDTTSCHLDAGGVEAAGTGLRDQIQHSDIVVLSKFGKLEAMHEGLSPAFEAAIAAGKPLLTTVSELHRAAWNSYAPDAATLAPEAAALQAWWRGLQRG